MQHAKDILGAEGEAAAADHLGRIGMRVIDRNWRCRYGELDIVALEGDTIAFVEVKTRRGSRFGHPFEAITHTKLRRIRQLAGLWMQAHDRRGRMRIDAIAVIAPHGAPMRIEHLKGVS